jgi:hypothetical protein
VSWQKSLNIIKSYYFYKMGRVMMQLVCDTCGRILLEKPGLSEEQFPITTEEAQKLDGDHRGHACHIEAVEKDQ